MTKRTKHPILKLSLPEAKLHFDWGRQTVVLVTEKQINWSSFQTEESGRWIDEMSPVLTVLQTELNL